MARNLLTDRQCSQAKAKQKPYRLFDGEGLALFVATSGATSWQLRYPDGTATLGKYPVLSLAAARKKADEVRALIGDGQNFAAQKREKRLERRAARANTFGVLRKDWLAREARRCKWSETYRAEVEASLENHLSSLDPQPVTGLTAQMLAPVLRKVEARAPLMLEKVRRRLNGILWYGVETGSMPGNPLPAVRRGNKLKRNHYPAVTTLPELGEILRKARAGDPCKGVTRAHLLVTFTALRASEVVGATWAEFALDGVEVPVGEGHHTRLDPDAGNWTIPRSRMKQKDSERPDHVVPLPSWLLTSLREWRAIDGADAIYVCPAPRDASKSITIESLEKFYRQALGLAGKHSPHSWRSAFSTVCREAGKEGDTVEAQLDHIVGTKVASAYDRAKRVELRRELLNWYEATLIAARDGATVTSIRKQA